MQRWHVKLLVVAVFISMLVVLPDQVDARYIWDDDSDDEPLDIEVHRATYLDYDADGQKDDIIVVFELEHPDDDWKGGHIDISCAVAKPSGVALGISFSVKTAGEVEITIVWFNFVDESGWYTFYCKAAVRDNSAGPAYIKYEFDPPKGDPGPPEIAIMSIKEL